jgi:hypothetical protein
MHDHCREARDEIAPRQDRAGPGDNANMLIVINGPIASGKSSLARAVARQLQVAGSAAAIDVDLIYDMLQPDVRGPKSDDLSWHLARLAAAAITDTFLSGGVDAVVVEGAFYAKERAAYLGALRSGAVPRFITLRVGYDEALRRAQTDPTRGASRDPAFLRRYFGAMEPDIASVPDTDLVLDTETLDLGRCVDAVIAFAQPGT